MRIEFLFLDKKSRKLYVSSGRIVILIDYLQLSPIEVSQCKSILKGTIEVYSKMFIHGLGCSVLKLFDESFSKGELNVERCKGHS